MQDATASEPLTLDEEYENQVSWREAHDKLTFIVCRPRGAGDGGTRPDEYGAREEHMRGDVNLFLYPDDEEPHGAVAATWLVGEVDVMIADEAHTGQGLGSGAVRALLTYVQRHEARLLAQYGGGRAVRLRRVMAKIKEGNRRSTALFERLGFAPRGRVNYFGERTLARDWPAVAAGVAAWAAADEYAELGLGDAAAGAMDASNVPVGSTGESIQPGLETAWPS